MVAKSRKGTLTKQNIINAAKQLFYENGYNKTGIQDIADFADVKLGTITYYFKKKDDMISDIYNTFFMELYDYVSDTSEKDLNLCTKYCYALVLYYDAILSDPKNTLLYYEVLIRNVDHSGRLSITKTLNRSCLDFLNKSYNETDLEVIGLAEFGARKELFIDYYEREIALTKDQMNYYFIKALFRLMDLDGDMIKNTIQQAFEFLKDKKPEQIKFLV
ncbi:MAG: TetR/AcrR family transcriptional regulator [Eubacterium sp.]